MNRYKVAGGVANFGPGALILVSEEQLKRRAHNCEMIDRRGKGIFIRAKTALQFKVGEEIGLEDLPKNLIGILEPLGKPKSETDMIAAAKAEERAAPAAKSSPKAPPVAPAQAAKVEGEAKLV